MKIILIDDNKTFRECFQLYLENKMGYTVIASYNNGKEFLASKDYLIADIILMDIDMPELNGIAATKLALWEAKHLKIIAISGFREKAYLMELIGAGCKGCVFKDNIYDELETAINTVNSGKLYFPDKIKIQ